MAIGSNSIAAQLRTSPQLWWLMLAMAPGPIALVATGIARIRFATDTFGSEVGVGALATTVSLAGAVISLPSGFIVDRWNPRYIMVSSLVATAVMQVFLSVAMITMHPVPAWILIGVSAAEGILVGITIVSLAPTQAALVPPGARGPGEILNSLRLGIASILGALLASVSPNPTTTTTLGIIGVVIAAFGGWWFSRPATFERTRSTRSGASVSEVIAAMRSVPAMRGAVVASLVQNFIYPTELVALTIINRDAYEITGMAVTAGIAGSLAGKLLLAGRGLSTHNRRELLITYIGVIMLTGVSALLMTNDWLLTQLALLVGLIAIASGLMSYGIGLADAMCQQYTPDDIRGRITGLLNSSRKLLVAAAVIAATYIIQGWDTRLFLVVLTVAAVVALLATRGFRSVDAGR